MRTFRTDDEVCDPADEVCCLSDELAELTGALQRLQRCLAVRLAVSACCAQRSRGRWSVRLEANLPSQFPAAPSPSPGGGGRSTTGDWATFSASAIGSARSLPLAVAVALADLALESGLGLTLFAQGTDRRRNDGS